MDVGLLLVEAAVHLLILRSLLPLDLAAMAAPATLALVGASRWLTGAASRIFLTLVAFVFLLAFGLIREHEAYAGAILADSWLAIFQTDFDEASGYATSHFSMRVVWLSMASALWTWAGVVARRLLRSTRFATGPRLSTRPIVELSVLSLGVLLVATLETTRPLRERIESFHTSFATFSTEINQQKKILDELKARGVEVPSDASPAEFEGTVILVLGESTTRRSMSLYGYHRDTTPRLNGLGEKLLVHRDTISPHSHTVPSLKEALTVADFDGRYDPPEAYARSLPIELRRAGFKTWWLSNQNEFGVHDNPISLLGKQSNVVHFRRKSDKLARGRPFWDHELLPLLDQALADPAPRRFIVLHLYSTHTHYCEMLPPQHRDVLDVADLGPRFFGAARNLSKDVNCYDNAVRYIDGIVGQVADRVLESPGPTVMLFFSDHGENPTDRSAHESSRHSTWHVEIPHLWLFNEPARLARAEQVAAFSGHLQTPFKSSDMFHLMLDLVGADTDLLERSRSLFSRDYEIRPRRSLPRKMPVAGLEGMSDYNFVAYDERRPGDLKDHLGNARVNLADIRRKDPAAYGKLWAHRVNSIGKMLEAKQIVAGVEIDVTFDAETDRFRVFRGDEEDVGLLLEELLSAALDRPGLRLRLDWKNAGQSNLEAALARLDALDARFALRGRALVEAGADAGFEALQALSAGGYTHSHYLHMSRAGECVDDPGSEVCRTFARETAQRVRLIGASHLSFDYRAWPFVRHHRKTFHGVKLAAWDLDRSMHEPDFPERLPDLEPLEALLVPFHSIFNR